MLLLLLLTLLLLLLLLLLLCRTRGPLTTALLLNRSCLLRHLLL